MPVWVSELKAWWSIGFNFLSWIFRVSGIFWSWDSPLSCLTTIKTHASIMGRMCWWTRTTEMVSPKAPHPPEAFCSFSLRSNQPASQSFYVTAQYNKAHLNNYKQPRTCCCPWLFPTLVYGWKCLHWHSPAERPLIAGPWDTADRNAQWNKSQEK